MYMIYFIVYAYAARMTSIEPERTVWGYICALVFAIISIWSISLYLQYDKKKDN